MQPQLHFDFARKSRPWHERLSTPEAQAAVLCILMFVASLVGILTMPVGFLASFWPANPLLIGLMVRRPQMTLPVGWVAAATGYIAADVLVNANFLLTCWLTVANLTGAAAGVLFFRRLSEKDRQLLGPASPLFLVCGCIIAGGTSAIVGGGAGTVLMGQNWGRSTGFWFVTEWVNGILLLPVILTAPPVSKFGETLAKSLRNVRRNPTVAAPLLTLPGLMLASLLIGGPGAVMFSTPALLYCALTYRLFTSALLTSLSCAWMLISVATGALSVVPLDNHINYIDQTMSLQLGISLMALGPLTAASMNVAREELLMNLKHCVNHDFLTGALGRRAFMSFGQSIIERYLHRMNFPERRKSSQEAELVPVVLMMDIDHFKSVNDRYGHSVGDQVIQTFAKAISGQLREGDLLGRLGGEEFAVLLPLVSLADAETVGERLRNCIASTPINLANGDTFWITTSIGIASPDGSSPVSLDVLLSDADQALYWSKSGGRNRVTTYSQQAAHSRTTLQAK